MNTPVATSLDELCINTIRMLSIDAVQQANSGHPGLPMGAATLAYVLWTRHLRHNPANPAWPDRDRFVLSAGHGSMLLYSLLFLTGYDLSIQDLKRFRQWGSRTPGHPERGCTPGVEVTTGPLGQGFGNGVGLAIAERGWPRHSTMAPAHRRSLHLRAGERRRSHGGRDRRGRFARGHFAAGPSHRALRRQSRHALRQHRLTFTEDAGARFEAYGWHVQRIDGQDDAAVDAALSAARAVEDGPSLIVARTHIGYGSPHKQDTFQAHGEPLGADEVRLTKRAPGLAGRPIVLRS